MVRSMDYDIVYELRQKHYNWIDIIASRLGVREKAIILEN